MSSLQLLFLASVFLAVSGLAYAVAWIAWRPRLATERLDMAGGPADGRSRTAEWQIRINTLAKPLARLALPKEGWEASGLRLRFLNAGWRSPSAPVLYFAAKTTLAFVLPLLLMTLLGLSARGLDWSHRWTLPLLWLAAATGYYLPNLVLRLRIDHQQRALLDAFPDAVDLIIVCIEAGLGLDAAISRCGQEMRLRCAPLADELQLVEMELRVGASREQALRNLALRTGIDDLGSLVAMLVQADRFGTSIAESLRVYADGLRTRRRQRAEEAAAKLPLKLIFPLIFCIFPALMLVLLGPAAISIFRVFAHA